MRALFDVNHSWSPPAGYEIVNVSAKGSYLEVLYAKRRDGDLESEVRVYLNDTGREVCRFAETWEPKVLVPEPVTDPMPLTRWQKFVKWADVNFGGYQ